MNTKLQSYIKKHKLDINSVVEVLTVSLNTNPFIVLYDNADPKYLVISATICEFCSDLQEAMTYLDTNKKEEVLETEHKTYKLKPYLENCKLNVLPPIKCLGIKEDLLVLTLPSGQTTDNVVQIKRNINRALQEATINGTVSDVLLLILPEGATISKLEVV